MSELEAILLGFVQGLTEFLPVSSSGHLVIAQSLLGVHDEGVVFEIAVHVATLASVLVFYRARVASLVVGALRGDPAAIAYGAKLAVATLPAVAAVLLAGDLIEAQFESPAVVGVSLIVTGGILWTTRVTAGSASLAEPTFAVALLIGCAQVVGLVPGISRSGVTVAAALALGVRPVAAAEFSFLMSVIAIAGAAVRVAPQLLLSPPEQLAPLAIACGVAMVSGIAAIWLFVHLLRTHGFHRFAYYTWCAGALFLAWLAFANRG